MTTEHLPEPGDCFDVFVVRGRRPSTGKLVGYLCKATAIWNGETQLLPYSHTITGFAIKTDRLKYSLKVGDREVHYFMVKRAA